MRVINKSKLLQFLSGHSKRSLVRSLINPAFYLLKILCLRVFKQLLHALVIPVIHNSQFPIHNLGNRLDLETRLIDHSIHYLLDILRCFWAVEAFLGGGWLDIGLVVHAEVQFGLSEGSLEDFYLLAQVEVELHAQLHLRHAINKH